MTPVATGDGYPDDPFQRRTHMDAYERMKKLIAECDDDIKKAIGGNKAAGTRVRKTMQEIKECAQSVRQAVLNLRDASEGGQA
jgi:methyl coenzyme M reductase gamma subunit